jgi:hypothetical protein
VNNDDHYREVLLRPLRVCLNYFPTIDNKVVDANGFIDHYNSDPFYNWMGLASNELFSAHKVSGGITSFYRQLGIGVERLFREILINNLMLSEDDVKWSYTIEESGKPKKLTLDGRIPLDSLSELHKIRMINWISSVKSQFNMKHAGDRGVIFEVRQGYKSADSKRTNADLRNATRAAQDGYIFVVAVMSTQINNQVLLRWRNNGILVLTGRSTGNEFESIFTFLKEVVGFDLSAFFERNTDTLKAEVTKILDSLLGKA